MSTILQILASSAVIVVIIEVVFQSKTNRVRFLTSSRAEWRSNLKQYAEELDKSKKRNISQVLTKIKMNLNGYGCYNQDEYPSDIQLDFFKDEHIWKEISYLEVAYAQDDPSKATIEEHKQRLIQFLGLLLKFDWERSKEEIKMNLMAIASVVAFAIMMTTCLIQIPYNKQDALVMWNALKQILIMALPFFIVWIPYLMEAPKFMKTKKWYKRISAYPFAWGGGLLFQLVLLQIFEVKYKIDSNFPVMFYMIAMFLAFLYPFMRRNMFIEYENAIMRIMKIDSLIVYSMKSQFNDMRALSFFIRQGLNSRVEYHEEVILNDEEFLTYFVKLKNKNELLRFFSRIKYCLKKEKERKKDVLQFLKEKPKRCKMIVKFKTKKPESVAKFSIGFKKKEWREWLQ